MNIVVLSGGVDSTATLAIAAQESGEVRAVSFDYGQRHSRELASAVAVASHYGVEHRIVNIRGLLSGSALLGAVEVPDGHYADPAMEATIVHGRNLLFASVALAQAGPGDAVWLGVHAGDRAVYPDCRPEFWADLAALAERAYRNNIVTPFLDVDKSEVVRRGARLAAPFDLTWSCYKGGVRHCGTCGTCRERREAFELAEVEDTTRYELEVGHV